MIKKKINIGIIGLGHIGSRLYKEIISKRFDIELKTGSKVSISAISAKNPKKKEISILKKIFFIKILFQLLKIQI